jgi:hypothetical protein
MIGGDVLVGGTGTMYRTYSKCSPVDTQFVIVTQTPYGLYTTHVRTNINDTKIASRIERRLNDTDVVQPNMFWQWQSHLNATRVYTMYTAPQLAAPVASWLRWVDVRREPGADESASFIGHRSRPKRSSTPPVDTHPMTAVAYDYRQRLIFYAVTIRGKLSHLSNNQTPPTWVIERIPKVFT